MSASVIGMGGGGVTSKQILLMTATTRLSKTGSKQTEELYPQYKFIFLGNRITGSGEVPSSLY